MKHNWKQYNEKRSVRIVALAGIQKTDERGRILDVHVFRMTFCTNMAAVGIPLQTAQAAMGYSDEKLTANVYTDLDLLDVRGVMNKLPEIVMDDGSEQGKSTNEMDKATRE